MEELHTIQVLQEENQKFKQLIDLRNNENKKLDDINQKLIKEKLLLQSKLNAYKEEEEARMKNKEQTEQTEQKEALAKSNQDSKLQN